MNFKGCIRDFRILKEIYPKEKWVSLDWSTALVKLNHMPLSAGCPLGLDDVAIHFLGTGMLYVFYIADVYILNDLNKLS